jgi:hypothetical protein
VPETAPATTKPRPGVARPVVPDSDDEDDHGRPPMSRCQLGETGETGGTGETQRLKSLQLPSMSGIILSI